MCGITGFFAVDNSFSSKKFAAANNAIQYRGPDDFGYVTVDDEYSVKEWKDESLNDFTSARHVLGAFGFRRLSIIDLSSSGHQPMTDSTGDYWIVFNGEVYNYIEIRAELERLGYKFRSSCDTEVVLYSYIEWGSKCLEYFNGMWGLAILDKKKKLVFCARDRFGIKPFHYSFEPKQFVFGSEVKQVLHLNNTGCEVNDVILFDFLAFGVKNHTNETFYKNVYELRGGECLFLDISQKDKLSIKKEKWWDLSYNPDFRSEGEIIEQMYNLLKDSTRIRLRSDVQIGTALSGGLDSTGLVALIDELTNTKQNVFTVYSKDKDTDEMAFAEKTIERYGLKSYRTEYGIQNIELLMDITRHHDQPLNHAGIFGGWILQKLFKQAGITVNINGQGADELMSGYSRPPHGLRYLDSLRSGEFVSAQKELYKGFKNSNRSFIPSLKIFANDASKHVFRAYAYRTILRKRKIIFEKDFYAKNVLNSPFLHALECQPHIKTLQKNEAYTELKSTRIPALLHNVDRDSTAHSLESRVPFLDYRVAEFIFNIPASMLTRNGYSKYIYRKSMVNKIPNQLLWNNEKKGFATPADNYLDIGSDFLMNQIDILSVSHAIDISVLRSASGKWSSSNTALYWRALCSIIWMNHNSTSYS